jgi:hypothetical protein
MSWTRSMARGPASGWPVHGSTVDSRWCGQRARWRAHRSLASGLCGARKLADGGATARGERGEPGGRLIKARAAVWRSGDGEETATGREVGNRGARASGEGESELGRCGEVRGGARLLEGPGQGIRERPAVGIKGGGNSGCKSQLWPGLRRGNGWP